MNNPIFNLFGGQQLNPMIQKFQQFKQSFRGDANQQIQQMLNSGKVSQAQYNQAVNLARQMMDMFGQK